MGEWTDCNTRLPNEIDKQLQTKCTALLYDMQAHAKEYNITTMNVERGTNSRILVIFCNDILLPNTASDMKRTIKIICDKHKVYDYYVEWKDAVVKLFVYPSTEPMGYWLPRKHVFGLLALFFLCNIIMSRMSILREN
jgi:hypothetical protein